MLAITTGSHIQTTEEYREKMYEPLYHEEILDGGLFWILMILMLLLINFWNQHVISMLNSTIIWGVGKKVTLRL